MSRISTFLITCRSNMCRKAAPTSITSIFVHVRSWWRAAAVLHPQLVGPNSLRSRCCLNVLLPQPAVHASNVVEALPHELLYNCKVEHGPSVGNVFFCVLGYHVVARMGVMHRDRPRVVVP